MIASVVWLQLSCRPRCAALTTNTESYSKILLIFMAASHVKVLRQRPEARAASHNRADCCAHGEDLDVRILRYYLPEHCTYA